MKCKRVLRRMQAYVDGELAPGEREGMKDHLHGCPSCAGELKRLRSLSALVKGLEAPTVDPPVWDGYAAEVLKRARAAPERIPLPERTHVRRLLPVRWIAVPAFFLVFAAGLLYYLASGPGERPYTLSQRPVVERFEAGGAGYSVMSFEPEKAPVAVVWIFGYRIENGAKGVAL